MTVEVPFSLPCEHTKRPLIPLDKNGKHQGLLWNRRRVPVNMVYVTEETYEHLLQSEAIAA
jgi:hypothetical protein